MFAPPLTAAHATARVSSIWLANSGGVNTSSLERFAMQVRTSGLDLIDGCDDIATLQKWSNVALTA